MSTTITRVLNDQECCDLFLLHEQGLAPLKTYMTRTEYLQSLINLKEKTLKLDLGYPVEMQTMPIPIVLPMTRGSVKNGDKLVLKGDQSSLMTIEAILIVSETYPSIWGFETAQLLEIDITYFTTDIPHPYCNQYLKSMADRFGSDVDYVTGRLVVTECQLNPAFEKHYMSPSKIQSLRNGGDIVAFQTRNPLHQAHVALIVDAVKQTDTPKTVVINPTLGPTQLEDIPIRYRLPCYDVAARELRNVFKSDYHIDEHVHVSLIPIAMRMLGPREAVWHALIRQNYNFTHFIVGRDHAGPSSKRVNGAPWFHPSAASSICQHLQPAFKTIKILTSSEMGFNPETNKYERLNELNRNLLKSVSGTELRNALKTNTMDIPNWFSYPEVLDTLKNFYKPRDKQGFCVQMTGFSGSGKTTIAEEFKKYWEQSSDFNRQCVILDGDVFRNYFKDLGFDRQSRSTQTRRIGFIASLLVKQGALVLCANIAPYAEDRDFNRQLMGEHYIEVFVGTSLDECEKRDVKGLYKKARKGEVQNFTGISDPFETPSKPELTITTEGQSVQASTLQLINYLKDNKWIR
jgi:sulfate adenylyltransferase